MTDFNNFSTDITKLGFKLQPGVQYKFQIDDGYCKDEYETTNLDLNILEFLALPVIITGQVIEYKANVMSIQLSFDRNVLYNEGVVRLYHEDSTLIQTWDSNDLSAVNNSTSLVLSINDPYNTLDRFTNYYVELEDDNFISEDRVLTKTNSWVDDSFAFSFNTGDHDILPYSALVTSLGTISCQLTYVLGNFTSNQSIIATQNALGGYPLETGANIQSASNITCILSPANTFPHFLYFNHTYQQSNDRIVMDSNITTAQNLDVLDHITGLNGYVYTLTITPNDTSYVNTLSTTSTLGTQSFDNTSKVLTITGNETQISDNLDKLQITLSGVEGNFSLTYSISNNIDSNVENKTIDIKAVDYPTFTSFDYFAGVINAGARNTPRTKADLYSQYDENTYPWINDTWFLDVDAGIYQWRVPETATYMIYAKGSQGALMQGTFDLIKDEEIEILCGLIGSNRATTGNVGLAGNGGTFVVKKKYIVGDFGIKTQVTPTTNEILVIAGGSGTGFGSASNASTTETPNSAYVRSTFDGVTGSAGQTITYNKTLQDNVYYFGTATSGAGFNHDTGGGGKSFVNGGLGARLQLNTGYMDGGFGGGGAGIGKLKNSTQSQYRGGGGGYIGGGAAIYISNVSDSYGATGAGGSSYSNALNMGGSIDNRWSPDPGNIWTHPFVSVAPENGYVSIIKQ